ncbi:MAG: uracil-DNA glycosylase family protein, partial [Hyphomonas sp.]|nr:uracil-DNA glycosylase family protein [Hyphomonas sp.]
DRLRDWMGVSRDEFYDASRVGIFPMGLCFPGYDAKGGDLPPMKRCAPEWRPRIMPLLKDVQVTLLVGGYAQKWHLGGRTKKSLTETVADWKSYTSERIFTTPHPSWRNTAWLKRNPWFGEEVVPALRRAVRDALSA